MSPNQHQDPSKMPAPSPARRPPRTASVLPSHPPQALNVAAGEAAV